MRSFVVAKAFVINDEGKMLVLRRSPTDKRRPGQLDFPGGWVDEGEDASTTVIRETAEEAGLDIDNPRLVFGLTETDTHGSGTWVAYVAYVTGNPEVKLSYEHDEYRWIKPEEALAESKYERQRKMLRHAIENDLFI